MLDIFLRSTILRHVNVFMFIGVPQEDDYNSLWSKGELSEGLVFGSSRKDSDQYSTAPPPRIIRPMSRKDIFYSGSIVHLPEYQSQKSIASYRQSVLNLPKAAGTGSISGSIMTTGPGGVGHEYVDGKAKPAPCCSWLSTGAFKSALEQLMDFELMKNPVFIFIAVSNVFGMLGFYVPFVYLIDSAIEQVSLAAQILFWKYFDAMFMISSWNMFMIVGD